MKLIWFEGRSFYLVFIQQLELDGVSYGGGALDIGEELTLTAS